MPTKQQKQIEELRKERAEKANAYVVACFDDVIAYDDWRETIREAGRVHGDFEVAMQIAARFVQDGDMGILRIFAPCVPFGRQAALYAICMEHFASKEEESLKKSMIPRLSELRSQKGVRRLKEIFDSGPKETDGIRMPFGRDPVWSSLGGKCPTSEWFDLSNRGASLKSHLKRIDREFDIALNGDGQIDERLETHWDVVYFLARAHRWMNVMSLAKGTRDSDIALEMYTSLYTRVLENIVKFETHPLINDVLKEFPNIMERFGHDVDE